MRLAPVLTPELLDACTGCGLSRARVFAPELDRAMAEFAINTPARIAAFLAQVAHESGNFKWLTELWGPTEAQKRYEGRADLGNTQPGDGFLYRGRGLIQVTGRRNYSALAAALGIPLLLYPERLAEPTLAARSAAYFWKSHGCNELAEHACSTFEHANYGFREITRRINGGLNGYTERLALWERAKRALAQAAKIKEGAHGPA